MKKLQLDFPSGSYLLMELPEGFNYFEREDDRYRLIGKLSSLQEEDYAGIVGKNEYGFYNDFEPVEEGDVPSYGLLTAKESFESAAEAAYMYIGGQPWQMEEWTFNPETTYLFKRI